MDDGTFFFKDEKMLMKELGTLKKVWKALKATAVLALDKVELLMVRSGMVIRAGGLPEVRLRCLELCTEYDCAARSSG
ncbi:unnamed protein product [Closterium sp. NIES-65]|nr:unnamed protein product [Closterium sp. NIES-65]